MDIKYVEARQERRTPTMKITLTKTKFSTNKRSGEPKEIQETKKERKKIRKLRRLNKIV